MVQGYVFCLLHPAEVTREGPTRTPPRKTKTSVHASTPAFAAADADAVEDSNISREDRLSKLGDVGELKSDDEDEVASPPSLSPRSLRALQQRVAGTPGVDPNIVGSSGGLW